jgi:hypothetical protein
MRLARNGKTPIVAWREKLTELVTFMKQKWPWARCSFENLFCWSKEMIGSAMRNESERPNISYVQLCGPAVKRRTGLRTAFMTIAATALIYAPTFVSAQTAADVRKHVPLEKTIGQASTEVVPSLIVFNSRGVSLDGNKLVLTGVAPNSIIFADRPVRAAGHDLTAHVIEDWSKGSDNFAKDPPNATVSGFTKDGKAVKDVVVVLKSPKLDGDRLSFDVDVLEGDLTGADGAAAVFIDIIGRPLTPLSYAGVARRTAYRGAYYRAAAVGTAAAVGAAAAAYYHPYYYRPPCGYYPYPPCY